MLSSSDWSFCWMLSSIICVCVCVCLSLSLSRALAVCAAASPLLLPLLAATSGGEPLAAGDCGRAGLASS